MTSSKGGKSGGGRRGLSGGGDGVPWFAGTSRFAGLSRNAGAASAQRARFTPGLHLLEARTLLTLPLVPGALSTSVVSSSPGTPQPTPTPEPDGAQAGIPQQVSGAYLVDGAESAAALTFDKVVQGFADTCTFDATLSAVAMSNLNLAPAISFVSAKSPTDFVYNVRLYQPAPGGGSEPVEVSVDFNGTFAPGDLRSTDPNEFWPTLFQRAYLQLESTLGQDYHFKTNAFLALTGLSTTDEPMANVTPTVISGWLGAGNPVVAGTESNGDPYTLDPSQGIIGNHSYTVVGIGSSGGTTYVTLRNPWGNDSAPDSGSSSVDITDGIFRIPWATFTQYFTDICSAPISGPSINHPEASLPTFNKPPTGTISVYQDQSVTLDCSAVDPDGGNVSYALIQERSATLSQNGSFTWTPDVNDVGVNQFTVIARTSPWTVASESFSIDVVPPDPTVGGVVVSPATITTSGTDQLTLQATGLNAPAGSVVTVDFRVDILDQSGQGQTHADVGYATAATNWTWTGTWAGWLPARTLCPPWRPVLATMNRLPLARR